MSKLLILLTFFSISAMAQNVPTWSGGIGEDSAAEVRAKQAEFNLKFVFTLMEGDYLADVAIKIADGAGKAVLETTSDGPIFLAKLPAGKYEATLTIGGVAQSRKFALGVKGLRTEHLRWKRSPEDGPPLL